MFNESTKISYCDYHYGKGEVKVAKAIKRPDNIYDFKEFCVGIQLYGEKFLDSFREPSNKLVVPTDTIKNTVYVLAKKYPMSNPVEFGIDVSNHLLQKYSHVAKVQVDVAEVVWSRIVLSNNSTHTHGFIDKASYRNQCTVINNRANLSISAGIVGLEILKARGSSFQNFWTDEYTTLQPASDRIMSTKANITWKFDSFFDIKSTDHNRIFSSVKQIFAEQFALHDESVSVQHSIDVIARVLLNSLRELSSIELNLPNVHYLLYNLKQFNLENNNEVFTPTNEPFGNIYATLTKTEHSVKCFNEVDIETAKSVIKDIFHSEKVINRIVELRPFENMADLTSKINKTLHLLDDADFMDCIKNHKRLGDAISKNRLKFIDEEGDPLKLDLVDEIHKYNNLYEEKFGHIYILSVSGKSIEDILASMKSRLENEKTQEFNICVEEVKKIIHVRIPNVLNAFATTREERKMKLEKENKPELELKVNKPQLITSHILDLSSGRPAEGVKALLFSYQENIKDWLLVGNDSTNQDGRMSNLLSGNDLSIGFYKVLFQTGEYFEKRKLETFYPEVEVKFQIKDSTQKYHIPLLLNQYGYSTYRGS